ncbi:uncharacterized protein [Rutidosis leptorrhynchoides]|uniref:uncharacterized protein n=1 Tax=Rutidosis leptorrhynchoides TaxID=125765 RepID=UPI003A98F930
MTAISSRRDGKRNADLINEEVTGISFPAIRLHNTSCTPIKVQGYLPEFGYRIRRLHMDTGSCMVIMYEQCFRQLPAVVKKGIRPSTMALSGFSGESAWPIGTLDLKLELRDDNDKYKTRNKDVEYGVTLAHSRYDAILGRISLQRFGVIPSTVHGLVKFSTKQGIATLELNPLEAPCASVTVKDEEKSSGEALAGCCLVINPTYPNQKVKIGVELTKETKAKLHNILMTNLDVFCGRDADMTGYHQIPKELYDEEKKAFHTDHGIYYYTKMPFGIKNAGATYHRMIDTTFTKQIGHNLEAVNMKLKPSKCCFGEEEGSFLGDVITTRGIKANPKKIEAIECMPSPKTKKQVQSLNGKLAAPTRILSRAAERSLPFFSTLKNCTKKSDFKWTEEAVSSVLIAEREGVQMPIYFVSKALTRSELIYRLI